LASPQLPPPPLPLQFANDTTCLDYSTTDPDLNPIDISVPFTCPEGFVPYDSLLSNNNQIENSEFKCGFPEWTYGPLKNLYNHTATNDIIHRQIRAPDTNRQTAQSTRTELYDEIKSICANRTCSLVTI
jgi:hypothetical protein